ncbi:MAG: copper amine oxidase N-terminal domain-containing protein, partial [Oscillospiraceae bacterium]|nr:copper amine oxidase N-terminal domain-containing protein [Oscillospiraceae bacterium]
MKKTKILAGAVALSLMLSSASVFAETKMWNMPENTEGAEYYDAAPADMYNRNDDISVVFNGEIIAFNELYPVNIDGRVKLPFRELLENIGATVDYDESTGTVSAVRNNTEIKFALNSNTIYVNDNGNTSEFVMDSSIDIINDRTFVPVRFMAEAFGLTVGWDDSFKTVVITDID